MKQNEEKINSSYIDISRVNLVICLWSSERRRRRKG